MHGHMNVKLASGFLPDSIFHAFLFLHILFSFKLYVPFN